MLASVRGPVLFADDDGFTDEAAVFNTTVAHRPYVIIGATDVADVRSAVRFAAEEGRSVAVLNTGHGPSLNVSQDAVMITTRRMTGLEVDGEQWTARVEAGVTWGQVVEEAAKVGLAPLAGSSPQVGVVGYTLGGGVSVAIGRAFGYAADHVREIEIVTADGELRLVTPESAPDLFFALLGGKGNFGVVTAMRFSLFPVPELYAGFLQFPGENAREVLQAYRSLAADAPDRLTSSIVFLRAPDLPFVPEFMRGKLSVFVRLAYLGPSADGEALIAPLRTVAPVLVDTVTKMPIGQIATIANDPTDPGAAVEHFAMLDELSPSAMETILELAGPDSDGHITLVTLTHLDGAYGDSPERPNAVRRDVAFALLALTVVPPGASAVDKDLGRELTRRLTKPDGRKHPSYLSPADAAVDSVRLAYDEATYERLRTAKTTWDPRNMFRWNYNIPPRA
ncbi:FAD-binding oxidoreductase [Micromonospora sp. STR1_7]|uniref:FAD-binding oxidoreductase n=1 Tax=Micromonospora parastrephiae TaxID=2806101 RepID=A0ABS1XSH8_9ACTN|nr:FAD-binding oxidoreductase [Micromonospora parastrephiae]MBM0232208.1 FAD-binding oxidoreductase [Micromonospora parastrephiae]